MTASWNVIKVQATTTHGSPAIIEFVAFSARTSANLGS